MARTKRHPGVEVERLDFEAADDSTHHVWFGLSRTAIKWDDTRTTNAALVAAEFVSTRLAIALGVPVPMGDAGTFEAGSVWVSAQIALEGQTLPPANPNAILKDHPEELALIFAFDLLIGNSDRHEENLLYHPGVGLWAIDQGDAFGKEAILDPTLLDAIVDQPIDYPALNAKSLLTRTLLEPALKRVRTMPLDTVRGATDEAVRRRLLTAVQAHGVKDYLASRRDGIMQLAAKSLGWEGGSSTWKSEALPGT